MPLVIIDPSEIVEKVKGEDRAKKEQSEHIEHCNNVINKGLDDNKDSEKISKAKCYSQYSLAKSVIENNLISQCPERQAFIVVGSGGKKYCVTLYPEDCQCPLQAPVIIFWQLEWQ